MMGHSTLRVIWFAGQNFVAFTILAQYHIHSYVWIPQHIFETCLVHITRLQFQIFNNERLAFHFIIFCSKIAQRTKWDSMFMTLKQTLTQMANFSRTKPLGTIKNLKISIHGIPYIVIVHWL